MTSGLVTRDTLAGCAICSVVAVTAFALAGKPLLGAGLMAGLMLGSLNVLLIQRLLQTGAAFTVSSLFRIALFSLVVLAAALVLRSAAWTLPLGIGVAQLVMVAAGLRRGFSR